MISKVKNEVAIFLLAVQFLTRCPLPNNVEFTPERQAESVRYYGLVGVLIGGMSALIFWLIQLFLPLTLAVLISTAMTCLLTGAFHEDGLADTFDGIGGGLTRARALAIMKDSRIGTYGAVALGLILAIKVSTLSTLSTSVIMVGLATGHGLSRFSAVVVIATSQYVRDHGTGKPTAGSLSLASFIFNIILGVLCAFIVFSFISIYALFGGIIGLVIGHVSMRLFFEPKLGGYTGDNLGAVQQVSEVCFYLGVAACL